MDTTDRRSAFSLSPTSEAFGAGLVAALAAVAAMLLFRLGVGIPSFPELFSDTVISLIPGPVFSFALDHIGHYAKPLLFLSLLAGQVALGGFLGVLYAKLWDQATEGGGGLGAVWRTGLSGSVVYAVVLWLLTMVLLLPLVGAGLFGLSARAGNTLVAPATLFLFLTYGLVLFTLRELAPSNRLEAATEAPSDTQRRSLLGSAFLAGAGLVAGGAVVGLLVQLSRLGSITQAALRVRGGIPPEVTPNEEFYIVSKNFIDPVVNKDSWSLEVDGLVENPLTLRYGDLLALPSVTQYTTLECISNPVGGDLMSNAQWRGVPLRALLERAKVAPQASEIIFGCSDEYTDSIPLEKALDPTTLVVYQMNGEPLPHKHGFPARLIVPGIYGMKNVKWLTSITLVQYDYKGYWEQQGWSDTAVVKTTSRIDLPGKSDVLSALELKVGGVAFAGNRGIAKVEVSFDDGQTWQEAMSKNSLSPFTWVLWTANWEPPKAGSYRLKVRATDKTGEAQILTPAAPFPDGASGLHRIEVRIV